MPLQRSGPVTTDTSTVALGLAQIRVGRSAPNIANSGAVLTSSNSIGALGNTKFASTVDYWKLESGFPQLEDMSLPLRESAAMETSFKQLSPFNVALARGIDPLADIDADIYEQYSNTTSGTTTWETTPITVDNDGGVIDEEWTVVFTSPSTYTVYGRNTGKVGTGDEPVGSEFAPTNDTNPYFTVPASFFTGSWATDETYVFVTTPYLEGTAAYADAHSGEIKLGALQAPAYVRMESIYTYPDMTHHMYVIFPRANVTSSLEVDYQAEDAVVPPMTFEAKRADSEVTGGHATWDEMPLGRIYWD